VIKISLNNLVLNRELWRTPVEFSFDSNQQRTYLITGSSGSGKSTLLSLLSLMLPFTDLRKSGDILVELDSIKEKYSKLQQVTVTQLRRQAFSIVLQNSYLIKNFSCMNNLRIAHRISRSTESFEKTFDSIIRLQAFSEDYLKTIKNTKSPATLSLGEKQRLSILKALVVNPRVIFADEPTASLDEKNEQNVLDLLKTWVSEPDSDRLLVIVTHKSRVIEELGTTNNRLDLEQFDVIAKAGKGIGSTISDQ